MHTCDCGQRYCSLQGLIDCQKANHGEPRKKPKAHTMMVKALKSAKNRLHNQSGISQIAYEMNMIVVAEIDEALQANGE
jgi:hypothetical protein